MMNKKPAAGYPTAGQTADKVGLCHCKPVTDANSAGRTIRFLLGDSFMGETYKPLDRDLGHRVKLPRIRFAHENVILILDGDFNYEGLHFCVRQRQRLHSP